MAKTLRSDVLFVSGEWVLEPEVCERGGLPQKLASAFGELFGNMIGASYTPMVYCGHQLVNGTNYMIVCKVTYATETAKTAVVKVVLHETNPDGGLYGDFSILSIETIVEDAQFGGYVLDPFGYMPGVLSIDPIAKAFEKISETFEGSHLVPLVYCGKQFLSPGNANVMFVCSSGVSGSKKISGIDAVVLNNKGDDWTVASIKAIV